MISCFLDHDLVAISSPEMVAWEKIESESKGFSSKESSNGLIKNPIAWRNRKFASDLKFDSMCQQATKLVDQECTIRSSEDPRTLASSKVVGDRKINLESQLQMMWNSQVRFWKSKGTSITNHLLI